MIPLSIEGSQSSDPPSFHLYSQTRSLWVSKTARRAFFFLVPLADRVVTNFFVFGRMLVDRLRVAR
jgi:hypothetical protein